MSDHDYDVIVAGAGNAALAAAVSACENGAKKVAVLEKAPKDMRGGNTYWSGGLLRIAFNSVEELDVLVPDAEQEYPGFRAGIQAYREKDFWDDLLRVTGGPATYSVRGGEQQRIASVSAGILQQTPKVRLRCMLSEQNR